MRAHFCLFVLWELKENSLSRFGSSFHKVAPDETESQARAKGYSSSLNLLEKLGESNAEGSRDLLYVYQRHVALSALDTTDVCPVEAAQIGKLLLGHTQPPTSSAERLSKPNSNVFHRGLASLVFRC